MEKYLRSTKSFSRRIGKSLSSNQKELLDDLGNTLKASKDLNQLDKIWLEIGSGGGEHALNQAKLNPDVMLVACEPYLNGIVALLQEIRDKKIENVRIFSDDMKLLLNDLKDNFIEKIFILFPDPWPKTKQKKRRIISEENLEILYKKLFAGGEFIMATDHQDYAEWIIEKMNKFQHYFKDVSSKDYATPHAGYITTKYHQKAIEEGSRIYYFRYIKN